MTLSACVTRSACMPAGKDDASLVVLGTFAGLGRDWLHQLEALAEKALPAATLYWASEFCRNPGKGDAAIIVDARRRHGPESQAAYV